MTAAGGKASFTNALNAALWGLRTKGDFMAENIAVFRIMPEEPGHENEIKKKLSSIKSANLKDTKIEPFAFGLNSINAVFVLEEREGALDALEEEIKKIKHVSDVRLEHITRI